MSTVKGEFTRLIQEQPDNRSPEEIVCELAFHIIVERGLADSDASRTIQMKQWNTESAYGRNSMDRRSAALAQ